MKRLILLSIFLLPSLLFSFEVNFNKSFSKKLKGDVLKAHININVEDKKELIINRKIEKFNKLFIDEKQLEKKGGNFNLSPRYKYYNHKQVFLKYVGSLSYTLESKDASALNEFISKLIKYKERLDDENVKLNISNISWIVSKKQKQEVIEDLNLKSIVWAQNYSKKLGKEILMFCKIKKINLNNGFSNPRPMYRSMAMADSPMEKSASVAPINTQKEVTLNASYIMECK